MTLYLKHIHSLLTLLCPTLSHHFQELDCQHFFVVFRWILVAFRREFHDDDIGFIWENLWAAECYSRWWGVFIAIAILLNEKVKNKLESCHGFDEVLKVKPIFFVIFLGGKKDYDRFNSIRKQSD